MSFLVLIGSIAVGTSIYFVKKHFFEDESDKLLRYKYMKSQDESEITKACYHYSRNWLKNEGIIINFFDVKFLNMKKYIQIYYSLLM